MGYNTSFDLEIDELKKNYEDVIKDVLLASEKLEEFPYVFCFDGYYFEAEESRKWYDHEEEMIKLSSEVTDVLFILHGEGEEQGDEWYKYFKNGLVQKCYAQVTFEPYDENKLK